MYGEGDHRLAESSGDRVIEVTEVSAEHTSVLAADELVVDLRPENDGEGTDELMRHAAPAVRSDADPAVSPASGPLRGRVAVVTGGALGVGREIALGLARAGARVCVLGRDVALLRETVELAGPDAAILYLQCDLGSVSEIEGVVDFITRFDRPVDLLVHAEGVQVRGGIEHGSVNDLDEQYLVNVRGPYVMSQQLLPQLRDGDGHVVFVVPAPSSVTAAEVGQFAVTAEAAGALAASLRAEVVSSGIRVTSVRPEVPAPGVLADDAAPAALAPADVAASVLHAVTSPPQVELTELRLRPRTV